MRQIVAETVGIGVADEPTGNLDSESAAEVMGLIVELRKEDGVTVIVATHDEDVAREASRRIRMRDGRIAAGAPEAAAGD